MNRFTIAAAVLVIAAGCSGTEEAQQPLAPLASAEREALIAGLRDGCEELDSSHCLLPFPSDRFTIADPSTATGRRINLPSGQLANAAGVPLDVSEWNLNDGFSPGSPMMARLDGVDLVASKAPPIGNIGRSTEEDSPTVLVDLNTGERLAHFVERDEHAESGANPLLIIRGARALPEGHTVAVAIRSLVGEGGATVESPLAFRVFRDRLTTGLPAVEARRDAMEQLFSGLDRAGVGRAELQLAWSFTVASGRSIAGPMVAMRDRAFASIGAGSPQFTVREVIESGLSPGIGRRVRGVVQVPRFLAGSGDPGSRLIRDEAGLPYANGTMEANFTCQIPSAAVSGSGGTTRAVVYGHGLLGSAGEAENTQVAKIASTNNMMYCATDWLGMSKGDLGNVAGILSDFSKFPTMPDRGLQGMLNTLFLARAMRSADGFSSNPAFHTQTGASVIDGAEIYFDGNSQGHIMGSAVTAVSQEWTKATLGVGAMNYSMLLDRSVDFDQYFVIMRKAYPNRTDQLVMFGIAQMLWDRIEGNGYAQHLTSNPYENTPTHQVLLHAGFGDHQVSTWALDIQARTIGATLRQPALAAGRHPDSAPFYGLEPATFPSSNSVLVYWDSGTLPAPQTNTTPATSDAFKEQCAPLPEAQQEQSALCADAHEDPRRAPASIEMKNRFFRSGGSIEDTCTPNEPCTAPNRFTLDY